MKVLYLTYDGLLDPLGESQILPYIKGIARTESDVVVLSFEKAERAFFGQKQKTIELSVEGIVWKSLRFTKGFGPVGKLWDLIKMYYWALLLTFQHHINVVHARGHTSAQAGLFVKKIYGSKLLFDFRGLWVDERVDKGGWNLSLPLDRMQYRHFKNIERKLLQGADQIVVLTHAVVNEVVGIGAISHEKITVIPCCADFDHFLQPSHTQREKVRNDMGMPSDAFVLGYLGSVGPMYMTERFLRLYKIASSRRDDVYALIITQDIQQLKLLMNECLSEQQQKKIFVKAAQREEVPRFISAFTILVNFVLPSYARISMSPTKMAECFAAGIPVLANPGVGDVAEQITFLKAGILVNPDVETDLFSAVERFGEVSEMGGNSLREKARPLLGLEVADERYRAVYQKIGKIF